MPHSGYTICTSEQLLASTAVSHSFTMARYSSPPFGSHGPCIHSEPCPLDFGTGVPCRINTEAFAEASASTEVPHARMPPSSHTSLPSAPSGFVAFTTSSGFSDNTIRYACSIDSLIRVSRRAESDPETKLNCHLHCTLSAKLPPPVNHHQDGADQQAAWPSFNIQGTMHCHVLRHSRSGIALKQLSPIGDLLQPHSDISDLLPSGSGKLSVTTNCHEMHSNIWDGAQWPALGQPKVAWLPMFGPMDPGLRTVSQLVATRPGQTGQHCLIVTRQPQHHSPLFLLRLQGH